MPLIERFQLPNEGDIHLAAIDYDPDANTAKCVSGYVSDAHDEISGAVWGDSYRTNPEGAFLTFHWPTLLDAAGAKLELISFADNKTDVEFYTPGQTFDPTGLPEFTRSATDSDYYYRVDSDQGSMVWGVPTPGDVEEHDGPLPNGFTAYLISGSDFDEISRILERTTSLADKQRAIRMFEAFQRIFNQYAPVVAGQE